MQPATDPRFHRGSDRIVGGVCSGLAEGLRIDALWIRIAFVLLAFVQGVGIFLYLILWLVMPEHVEGQVAGRSGFDSMTADLRRLWSELSNQLGGSRPAETAAPTVPDSTSGSPSPPDAPARTGARNESVMLGVALVVIGALFLVNNTGLVNWDIVWPFALVVLGVFILLRNAQRRA